jgi:hypothetical protein
MNTETRRHGEEGNGDTGAQRNWEMETQRKKDG